MTLKRGLNSLIHVNSSVRASTSERTTVHWTALAVVTICWVRGWQIRQVLEVVGEAVAQVLGLADVDDAPSGSENR